MHGPTAQPSLAVAETYKHKLGKHASKHANFVLLKYCSLQNNKAVLQQSVQYTPVGRQSITISVCVCLSVCLSVCPLAYHNKHMSNCHQIFCTCYP